MEGWELDLSEEIRYWNDVIWFLGEMTHIHNGDLQKRKNCWSVIQACYSGWLDTLLERSDAPLLMLHEIEEIAEYYKTKKESREYHEMQEAANFFQMALAAENIIKMGVSGILEKRLEKLKRSQ